MHNAACLRSVGPAWWSPAWRLPRARSAPWPENLLNDILQVQVVCVPRTTAGFGRRYDLIQRANTFRFSLFFEIFNRPWQLLSEFVCLEQFTRISWKRWLLPSLGLLSTTRLLHVLSPDGTVAQSPSSFDGPCHYLPDTAGSVDNVVSSDLLGGSGKLSRLRVSAKMLSYFCKDSFLEMSSDIGFVTDIVYKSLAGQSLWVSQIH